MNFIQVKEKSGETIQIIFRAYSSTFPEEERRDEHQFINLFTNPLVRVFQIINDDIFIGYLITWQLGNILFLEHFEVFQEYRNKNLGSSIIQSLKKLYPHIVLESEPESLDNIAARRVAFYQRNGFTILTENYIQPSYGPGKPSVNLFLMSTKGVADLPQLEDEIHRKVYGKNQL